MTLIFFKNLKNQKKIIKNEKKVITLRKAIVLLTGKSKVLSSFECEYFPKKIKGEGLTNILDHLASGRIARINKVSDRKLLKTLNPK